MADLDLHIKGGTVVDGTRAPRRQADVWIKDGKIAQIGGQAPGFAQKVIDAEGLLSGIADFRLGIQKTGCRIVRRRGDVGNGAHKFRRKFAGCRWRPLPRLE